MGKIFKALPPQFLHSSLSGELFIPALRIGFFSYNTRELLKALSYYAKTYNQNSLTAQQLGFPYSILCYKLASTKNFDGLPSDKLEKLAVEPQSCSIESWITEKSYKEFNLSNNIDYKTVINPRILRFAGNIIPHDDNCITNIYFCYSTFRFSEIEIEYVDEKMRKIKETLTGAASLNFQQGYDFIKGKSALFPSRSLGQVKVNKNIALKLPLFSKKAEIIYEEIRQSINLQNCFSEMQKENKILDYMDEEFQEDFQQLWEVLSSEISTISLEK